MSKIEKTLGERGYGLRAWFVPTHYDNVKEMQVNWHVTLIYDDKPILSTEYHQGIGHLKGYIQGMTYPKATVDTFNRLQSVLEGKTAHRPYMSVVKPTVDEVLYCLLSDGEAIDYPTFEDWASEYGYDPDSRKAEKAYKACMEIGLKLRDGLGDTELAELREVFQDY